jgi:hypothetical protein
MAAFHQPFKTNAKVKSIAHALTRKRFSSAHS